MSNEQKIFLQQSRNTEQLLQTLRREVDLATEQVLYQFNLHSVRVLQQFLASVLTSSKTETSLTISYDPSSKIATISSSGTTESSTLKSSKVSMESEQE